MLSNISYHFKVPLMLSATILLTGSVVGVALVWRVYEDLKVDMFRHAVEVGSVLSNTLTPALKHDDLWQAYRIVEAAGGAGDWSDEKILIVLDEKQRVYVSTQPRRFPVMSELRMLNSELAHIGIEMSKVHSHTTYSIEHPEDKHIYAIKPIVDDGALLGTLVMGYSRSLFLPKFYAIAKRIIYSLLLVMAILLPLGWYLGKRAVRPLTKLAECLSKVGHQPLDEVHCSISKGADEIGKLGYSFSHMLDELQEKQRLEREIIASEQLAAVGRLAAGVAHEINNPLGGMLNAINTFRRHGKPDPMTEKTISLLERGLTQISETVSALLVEARSESHALTPEDIDDIYTLLQPDAQKRSVQLRWRNGLAGSIPLPSTPVRQMLINLSLNAVEAAPGGSMVSCNIYTERDQLYIHVDNDGVEIPHERINELFEPFVQNSPSGRNGLGLWVTYQIVQQLKGKIDVNSDSRQTRFSVELPLEIAA